MSMDSHVMKPAAILAAGLLALSAMGCTHSGQVAVQGQFVQESGAGDAIAANTALQVIDPWPRESADVRLRVPADRSPAARQGQQSQAISLPSLGSLLSGE